MIEFQDRWTDKEQEGIVVCVVAPTPALRAGLRAMLNNIQSIEVIYELSSLAEFDAYNASTEILVLAPGAGSNADIRDVLDASPALAVLMIVEKDPSSTEIAIDLSGRAWGILSLDATSEELETVFHALNAGLIVGTPELISPLMRDIATNLDEQIVDPLTDRELQVLQLLAQGLANKQIASQLGISEHTVKFHVSGIYTKLGATNRTEAVRLGVRNGLILL